jgi:hypothetical protein
MVWSNFRALSGATASVFVAALEAHLRIGMRVKAKERPSLVSFASPQFVHDLTHLVEQSIVFGDCAIK